MNNFLVIFSAIVTLALSACSGTASPSTTPVSSPKTPSTLPQPKGEMINVTGEVEIPEGLWSEERNLSVFAAPFSGDAAGNGIYLLDPAMHPRAPLNTAGFFQIGNLSPGRYVLVVGPSAERSKPILNENLKPAVIEIKAGEILNLGQVKINP
jgi:hypothetical protein